ncbi:MAG: arabinogalactan endo-1,4-beta-galactosidase [Tannerellaceae bacterium]|nr:arabinogalactan endo-1,4-beta-galactosidase [Tannerellaceae bacterium]
MKHSNKLLLIVMVLFMLAGCSDHNRPDAEPEQPPTDEMETGFAKGADVGWLTEMEAAGRKFYNSNGQEMDCIELLKDLGMNSIRLRVWVDPEEGWNNAEDVLFKAWRAHNLGMRLMIDFHYSDTWADPGNQTKPAAWANLSFEELKTAMAHHTTEVLTKLKNNNIDVGWVQIGNETADGLLWEDGRASGNNNANMPNYAALITTGYEAAKSVYPDTKVIVHLDRGDNNSLYRWNFDGLKNNGGKWDVIGMSLYPEPGTWQQMNNSCLSNIQDMISRYGTEVMICEVGMSWDQASACKSFLTDLIEKARSVADEKCLGVFYWEPEAYGNWKGYTKGAFDDSGRPTIALDAFFD